MKRFFRAQARYWRSVVTACLPSLVFGWSLAIAHVPVPASVLDPRTAPEAWNVLRLATANVERLMAEDRLAEVPDQVSMCSPALRALPGLAGPPEHRTPVAEQTVRGSVAVTSLAQACIVGDRASAAAALENLKASLKQAATFFDPKTLQADIFCCPMHPDFVSADPATPCEKCGMGLLLRRIPYSFIYVPAGAPSLRLTARTDVPMKVEQPVKVTIRLSRADQSPVLISDLAVMHTQPIHLLIVDKNLGDYHHEHPQPTGIPGEYAFSFTPALGTSYRVFADLVPNATGVQEYPFTDLPGPGATPPVLNKASTFSSVVDGWHFRLTFDGMEGATPQAQRTCSLRISVEGPDGKAATGLEPVMAAFAHLVGFYDDGRTVVHLHPAGGEINDERMRGGPVLDFKFYPPKAGFVRLYCQVQIQGRAVYAPFNVNVAP